MEEFWHTYVRLCKENHVDVQECVVDKLKCFSHASGKDKNVLDLSANSLTAKTCAVLGKCLSSDHTFVELKFADCMLNEDAIKELCHGLSHNSFCKKLDLKGNNIRGSGVEALGKMLQNNNTLVSLCLEWNALGLLDDSFAMFCDAIGCNRSLKALDLQNNQISHDGAAELASNLKRNICLKTLDLRWNNTGLLGGRAIIEMLKTNKILCRLELAGNNIPLDVLKSIDTAISNNADRQLLSNEYTKRTHTLTKHIKQIELEKCTQVYGLRNTLDNQEELLRRTKRSISNKIGNLQEALEDRKCAFNSLTSTLRLSITKTDLALVEQRMNDQNSVIGQLKQEMSEMAAAHNTEIRREKESEDLDRKCRNQQEQIYELKEQITHVQAELKLKASQFDERIQQEKIRQKEGIRDDYLDKEKKEQHQKHLEEKLRVLQISKDDLQSHCNQQVSLVSELQCKNSNLTLEGDTLKRRLEEMCQELAGKNSITMAEVNKVKLELTASQSKVDRTHQILATKEQHQKHLEEKLRVLQISKDDLQSHCNQQVSLVSELQCKNSNLTLEGDTLKRRLEEMCQELAGKNSITMAEVNKVKLELTASQSKVEGEHQLQNELRDKLVQADRELSEQLLKHRQIVEKKDREIACLNERLRTKEYEVSRILVDESQRAQILKSTIMNYVAKVPSISRSNCIKHTSSRKYSYSYRV